ncbi:hypothetical protein C8J57DRAFT_1629127 [Mycena rebaudengoi]|nr:hypothetical protein C8J57DRAFT_1629127 [Mycena rebaudengoi]
MVSSQYQEFVGASGEKNLCIWIPTHSSTKSTCPGYFDNSVAGSIPSGMPIFEALVKYYFCRFFLLLAIFTAPTYFFTQNVHRMAPTRSRLSSPFIISPRRYLYDLVIPANADPAPFKAKPLQGEVERFDYVNVGH